MSWKSLVRSALGLNVQVMLLSIVIAWVLLERSWVWIYGVSLLFHVVNLQALLWRRSQVNDLMVQSIGLRCIAWGVIAALLLPHIESGINGAALGLFAVGTVLHVFSVKSLGLRRTYFSVELEGDEKTTIRTFPYNWLSHPMAIGSVLQFVGAWWMTSSFHEGYEKLMILHVALTVLTALIEHFDFHFRDHFFRSVKGTFADHGTRTMIDEISQWSIKTFRSDIKSQCSMHRYIKTLPKDIRGQIDHVRYAPSVMQSIQEVFPNSLVIPLPMTDEIYISRYNMDRGGDQGLFDKHHDGNLRFMPGTTVVRSLLYLSSEDDLTVVFESTGLRAQMKTYDFGLLDFHKELHWVEGGYDPEKPPRILLKCNYYIDHVRWAPYRWFGIASNVAVFYVVKLAMEYSKSPRTVPQRFVGHLCNLFRTLNNLNPAAPVALVALVLGISTKFLLVQLGAGE